MAEDYIRRSGRAAAWRDGASAKPLTVSHGDRASGHALYGHVRVAASDVAGFVFSGSTPDTELRSSGLFDK